ncbi:hypothetical protein M2375_000899 [Comamonas sp. BIGb0152]|uniref:recombinase RecT n=1 Tax=Comamonas sp. BIGb0152 TaxID=2940601 RepID=UPI0021684511|nr:recombinase RecT [Comamonas sp. BIGb0152]MCS4292693.1 hypothetical protein [Comamonas sp. BIGb0152]
MTTSPSNSQLAPRQNTQVDLSPQTFEQALTFAQYLSDSNMVPKDFQGKPANCLIAMQWGTELGMKPLQAIQNIAVINGRPALWGDAVIALVLASPVCDYVTEEDDGTTATCRVRRKGGEEQIRSFSTEDARMAGLAGKQGPWTQYPKRMRQLRARAFALRDVFPDVLRGMAVAEELQDMETSAKPPINKDMGQAQVVKEPYPEDQFEGNFLKWKEVITGGRKTADELIAFTYSRNPSLEFTDEQVKKLRALDLKPTAAAKQEVTDVQPKDTQDADAPALSPEKLEADMKAAAALDKLYELGSLLEGIPDEAQRLRLNEVFDARVAELEG